MVTGKKDSEDAAEYVARKEYKKAIAIYKERLAKQPNSNLRLSLADTFLMDSQPDEAVREYKNLAADYTDQGFLVKAIAIYKKILKLRPGDSEVNRLLEELSSSRAGESQRPKPATSSVAPAQPLEVAMPVDVAEPVELGQDAIIAETVAEPVLEIEQQLFQGLSAEEFLDVAESLRLHHFEEDTIVVQEGDPGDSFFIVVRGQVRVETHDSKHQTIVLASLGEGEFFGEISLLTGRPRTATIITNLDSELLELTRKDYENIVARYPHVKTLMEAFHQQRAYRTIEAMVQSLRHES